MSKHTPHMTPTFGDLRALMQRSPSHATWRALVNMFDAWGEHVDEEFVSYARSHLSTWPSDIKRAPESWLRHYLEEGRAPALLSACTSLHLGIQSDIRFDQAQLTKLARCETLFDGLHILRAHYQWKAFDGVVDFLLAPWCASVNVLDLKGTPLGVEGLSQLTVLGMHLHRLEELCLHNTALKTQSRRDPGALMRILQSALCRRVKRLDLSYNQFGWGTGETLAAGLGASKHLESLNLSRCDFIGADMLALGQMTRELPTLHHLDLGHNHLDKDALDAFITQAHGTSLHALHLQGNAADLDTVNALARQLDLVELALGEADDLQSRADNLELPYEGLAHLHIQGRLRPVWINLFEDVDALPDLTTLKLQSLPSHQGALEELFAFLEESCVHTLHLESLVANERTCEALAHVDPPGLHRLEVDVLDGEVTAREQLLGIEWVARSLIGS